MNQQTQMIMTKDANKITRLMGLIIIKASKKFQSNRLLRVFGRSNGISKMGDIHEPTGDEWILSKCEKLFIGVFRWKRTARQWYKGF